MTAGASPRDRLVALTAHARHVDAQTRAAFGETLAALTAGSQVLVIETCHRVEAYLVSDGGVEVAPPPGARVLRGEVAARHAVSLAVGADSVVMGEDQILHQVRRAVTAARAAGRLHPVVDRLFTLALQAGRRSRSWRQGPPRSLADLALDGVEASGGSLAGRDVLVVGAGEMGRLAALAARRRGASVRVASRTAARAEALAALVGGRAVAFEAPGELDRSAAVLVALRGTWPLTAADADSLVQGAAAIVDLSAPPAVAEALAGGLGDRYRSIDSFTEVAPVLRPAAQRRFDALVEQTVVEYLSWLDGQERRDMIRTLAERVERERQAELAELWRRLPELDPAARSAIDGMTRHLAARLLREPIHRLGEDTDGRREAAVRDLFRL